MIRTDLYKAEGFYHVVEAEIVNGVLMVGEYEELYGADRDENLKGIDAHALASALGLADEPALEAWLKEQGRNALRLVKRTCDEHGIKYRDHLHA